MDFKKRYDDEKRLFSTVLADCVQSVCDSWKSTATLVNAVLGENFGDGDCYRKRVRRLRNSTEYEKVLDYFDYDFVMSANDEDASQYKFEGQTYLVVEGDSGELRIDIFENHYPEDSEDEYNDYGDYDDEYPVEEDDPVVPLKHLLTDHSLILVSEDGEPYSISRDHKYFDEIYQNVLEGNINRVNELKDFKNKIQEIVKGSVVVNEDGVFIKGKPANEQVVQKMKTMLYNGDTHAVDAMINFLDRLDKNPSYRVFNALYDFISQNDIEIDEDGYILAYKKIRMDWKDVYTGTIDNSVGKTVEVDRREVDEDMNKTCSRGLHACSSYYLDHYPGDRVVLVKIDPADVVAIPADYNNSKMRVCRYVVLSEITDNLDFYRTLYGSY